MHLNHLTVGGMVRPHPPEEDLAVRHHRQEEGTAHHRLAVGGMVRRHRQEDEAIAYQRDRSATRRLRRRKGLRVALQVLGQVDCRHTALAEFGLDAVAAL